LLNIKESYYDYKLFVSQKYISILILVASLVNLLLLIPDLTLIESTAKRISIIIVRVVFSLILISVHLRINKIKTFKQFAKVISICEIIAFVVFLFIFSLYSPPSFLIQTIGLIILIIISFFVPNQWNNMLYIAVLGSIGFFVCASVFVESVNMTEFWAALVYVLISILFCAISANNSEKNQFKEFKAKRELQHISSTDYLTKTANRFKMEEEAGRWIAFCKRHDLPLSLVFIDVDNMKIINDRFGHSAGDSVLANLAKMIQKQLRSSDILARWGGDEFIMLFPNVTLNNAIELTERIKNCIKEGSVNKEIEVSCSFGIVEMKEDSNFKTMLLKADHLMYEGKKNGKDSIQFNKVSG